MKIDRAAFTRGVFDLLTLAPLRLALRHALKRTPPKQEPRT